jgi:hypothetical protein
MVHMNWVIIVLGALLLLGSAAGLALDAQAGDPVDTGVTPRMGPAGPTQGSSLQEGLQPPIDPARVMALGVVALAALGTAVFLHRRQPAPK